ncbi:MAG: asparaginase domain-containing protein [Patescibacteria group bacterium]
MARSTIHFIITGGTIDSFYDGTKDTVTPLLHSGLPAFIRSLKLSENIVFTEICMKDSRALTKNDMLRVARTIQKSPHKKIIITHGTYTMPDTAKIVKANLERNDQTIIFTGSMIPLMGFAPSDAPFNLGYSIARVQELTSGIYVAMNGRVFSPEEVAKLLYEGRFISVFGDKK